MFLPRRLSGASLLSASARLIRLLFVGLLAWPAMVQALPPEVLCAEIAPMCFNTPRGPSGFIYELGRELLRRQGRSEPVHIVPLARMWVSVQKNAPVISLWVGRIPEREPHAVWIAPVLRDAFNVYTLRGKAPAGTLEEVRRLERIGVNLYGANLYAARLYRLGNIEAHASDEINGRMLLGGRIDGWIATRISARYFLSAQGLPGETIARGLYLTDYVAYLSASRSVRAAEIERWRSALQGMVQDGSYLAILKKYGFSEVAVGRD